MLDTGWMMQDAGCRMMQDAGCRMHDTGWMVESWLCSLRLTPWSDDWDEG